MTRTTPRRSRRLVSMASVASAFVIGLGVLLAGCGEDAEPVETADPTSSSTSEPTSESAEPAETSTDSEPEAQTIDVMVSGDTVTPNGDRVEAKAGEEIILRVTSDAPGEIHVHSTPEQEFTYPAGKTDLPLTIDQPGVVEVESHTLDLVIVQLEVR